MGKTNPQVDLYIDNAADFAQPILDYLREWVHTVCPEVEEKIKWAAPHFEYHGTNLCHMVAFKKHCAFGFWLGPQMDDPDGILLRAEENKGMGHLGKIRMLADLPDEAILTRYLHHAIQLIDSGVKAKPKPTTGRIELVVPDELKEALVKLPAALDTFENFSYSSKKEYLEWITEAKTEATRIRRIHQAVEWMVEGKVRQWKYLSK